ncbi:hypothetical protein Mapa_017504 [Marchantia paleacea]|nr:hypothetical protein Mapa_017504 [Marchantia paleacea]
MLIPIEAHLLRLVDKFRSNGAIRMTDQLLDISPLKSLEIQLRKSFQFGFSPLSAVCHHLLSGGGQRQAPHDHIPHVPSLGIEHGETVKLGLHPEIKHFRMSLQNHALVQPQWPHPISSHEPQLVTDHEGEIMQIARAEDDGIHILTGSILEMASPAIRIQPLEKGHFFDRLRPVTAARRVAAVGYGDRSSTEFVALAGNVLGRVTAPDEQHIHAFELTHIPDIMSMQQAPLEGIQPLELRHVWGREVAYGNHNVIEFLAVNIRLCASRVVILDCHCEFGCVL